MHKFEKLYSPHGGPRHLSTIPLKNFHLFKIADSVINFYFKKKLWVSNFIQVGVFYWNNELRHLSTIRTL